MRLSTVSWICSEAAAEAAEAAGGEEAAAAREVRARSVFERAFRRLRQTQPDAKEEAAMLLESWLDFESHAVSRCRLATTLHSTAQVKRRGLARLCAARTE